VDRRGRQPEQERLGPVRPGGRPGWDGRVSRLRSRNGLSRQVGTGQEVAPDGAPPDGSGTIRRPAPDGTGPDRHGPWGHPLDRQTDRPVAEEIDPISDPVHGRPAPVPGWRSNGADPAGPPATPPAAIISVSIGRVEVRALAQPAPPRRPRRQPPATMGLDEHRKARERDR
jgi:hypothetical protein